MKKPLGRPVTSPPKRFRARLQVARELRKQGWVGWRPVLARLGPVVSTRLVQESVSELKKRRAQRRRRWMASRRVSEKVLSPNVIWVQDATHVGRLKGRSIQAEVVKDRATLGYADVSMGRQAGAPEILGMLERLKQDQGLPLVWATDNGSAYRDQRVEEFLRREKVVHLLSRPRMPQDNGAAEKGIRELKEAAGLGKGTPLESLEDTAEKLKDTWEMLHQRARGSKGYRTPEELEDLLPDWRGRIQREAFFERACKRMEKAVEGGGTARQKRQAERQAVYETLEELGLVERTRGGKPLKLVPQKPEDIL